ncbi:MAG: hypothetical protein C4K58_03115 [Flavobacteriaceae bacterium]|nr:MAG: hypothetical protein C4K58_03115 [Flavobacteriaceae bacterium]
MNENIQNNNIERKDGWYALLLFFLAMLITGIILLFLEMSGIEFDKKYMGIGMVLLNALPLVLCLWFCQIYFDRKGKELSVFSFENRFGSAEKFNPYGLLGIAMMFFSLVPVEYLTELIPTKGFEFMEKWEESFKEIFAMIEKNPAASFLAIVILAPLLEEWLFRGVILQSFLRSGWKPFYAILTSSLIFGLIHGNPWQFVGATMLGAIMGYTYYRTGSIKLSMFLHFLNNGLAYLLFFQFKVESINKAYEFPPSELIFYTMVCLGLGVLMYKKTNVKWA